MIIHFNSQVMRAQGSADYDTYRQRDKSQYVYGSGGVRPKVQFAGEQHGNREENGDWLSSALSYGANDCQKSPEPDAHKSKQFRKEASRAKQDSKIVINLATYDDTSSCLDYKCHLEACANVNQWNKEEMGFLICHCGQAQSVLSDLSSDRRQHYKTLVRSLQKRFSPPNQTDSYRVQRKKDDRRGQKRCPS